jgi:glycyl-tRNA synthetase beta chain
MPQLLLEILSEEIPARMQARAQADLERTMMDRLTAAGLLPEAVRAFSGPRRLAVVVDGLPIASADVQEEVRGPRTDAADAAIQGFLRKAGIPSVDAAEIEDDPKKGRIYVARIRRPGRSTREIVAELAPAIIRDFHWPKSMRWGDGDLRWVRPISRILCTFDGEAVPFAIGGLVAGDLTEGHRVMGRGPFRVRRYDDYAETLRNKGHVVLDREERKEIIGIEARTICEAQGLVLVEDQGLLEEVAGLAEYPCALVGDMDPAFLDLPPEVIRLTMRTHQKYFAVRKGGAADGALAPKFIVVANLEAADGGARIAAGNARVLSARLNDARFFWDNDRRIPLRDRTERLAQLVFHEKLGSVRDKAERVARLADWMAPAVGASPAQCAEAAMLAKCDLVSDMVGEFPELEGVMGRYYALQQGTAPEIADAIRDHYRPKGPSDSIPSHPVSVTLALCDKLDTLAGFWLIGEKPTGSKDPFALRRAALGVTRTILENGVRVSLASCLRAAAGGYRDRLGAESSTLDDLAAFIRERLKVHLREQGLRHDLIDAVFALGDDDLVRVVRRAEALTGFLSTDEGRNLLAGYRRAVNILRSEERREGRTFPPEADPHLFADSEEGALFQTLRTVAGPAGDALDREDYAGAMASLSALRAPVDAFFDKVMVNAPDNAIRLNRLGLLAEVRHTMGRVADFSKIEG